MFSPRFASAFGWEIFLLMSVNAYLGNRALAHPSVTFGRTRRVREHVAYIGFGLLRICHGRWVRDYDKLLLDLIRTHRWLGELEVLLPEEGYGPFLLFFPANDCATLTNTLEPA